MKSFALDVFLLATLLATTHCFAGKIKEVQLTGRKSPIVSRKTLVLTNPYATPTGNQYINYGNSQNPQPIILRPASSGQDPQQYSFPSVSTNKNNGLNQYSKASEFVTQIDPAHLSSTQPETTKLNSYSSNGQQLTSLNANSYANLQARSAATTLEAPPSLGNKIVDQIFQRTNSILGGIGNTANSLIGATAKVSTQAVKSKGFLTQQDSELSTGIYSNQVDFANKVNQVNTNYQTQAQKIKQDMEQVGVKNTDSFAANKNSYYTSSYGSGFRGVV